MFSLASCHSPPGRANGLHFLPLHLTSGQCDSLRPFIVSRAKCQSLHNSHCVCVTMSTHSIASDIRSLCNVIALLLRIPKELRQKTTTNLAEQPSQVQSPLVRVEGLFEEAKQTLHKYYFNIKLDINKQQDCGQNCYEQLTLLLQNFEQKLSEIKTTVATLADNKRMLSNDCSGASDTGLIEQSNGQLFRYQLIHALTFSVVGISNLLITKEQYSVASASGPSTSSPNLGSNDQCGNNVMLSTSEESLVRLAIGHTMRSAFLPSLKCYLTHAEKLFPTKDNLDSETSVAADLTDCQLVPVKDELFLFKPIYLVFLQLLMRSEQQSCLHEAIRRDCYSTLIACFAIYRRFNLLLKNDTTSSLPPISSTVIFTQDFVSIEVDIRKQFEQYIAVIENQSFVIRELLLLFQYQPNNFLRTTLVNMLYKYFTQPKGVEILLDSTLDSDLTSERETTINERMLAIANMVTGLAVKDRSRYYENILRQIVVDLLAKPEPLETTASTAKHSVDIYWRTGSLILENIAQQSAGLVKSILIDSINSVFLGKPSDLIADIETAILVIHRLLLIRVSLFSSSNENLNVNNLTKQKFETDLALFFDPLFYIGLAFERTIIIPPIRTILEETLINALNEIPNSFYLLDKTIHLQPEKWASAFTIDLQDDRVRAVSVLSFIEPIHIVKPLVAFTTKLLNRMPTQYCMGFFFTLQDRLTGPQPQEITLLLIDSLNDKLLGRTVSKAEEESREELLLNDPGLIRFLSSTFHRMVDQVINSTSQSEDYSAGQNNDQAILDNWKETIQFCIAILLNLVEKLQQKDLKGMRTNSEQEEERSQELTIQELRSCYTSLGRLLSCSKTSQLFDPMERIESEQLYTKLGKLLDISNNDVMAEEPDQMMTESLEQCIRSLKHPLMPMRAHALFTIKKLIIDRDKSVEANFELIFCELKRSLEDSESYIYLAAINALSKLAVTHTEEVLPLLVDHFVQSQTEAGQPRSLSDRLKTGEVLRQLAHSIGDFATHYSAEFIGKLLVVVQSTNPETALRISALSCLGEYCSSFRFGLSRYMVELLSMVDSLRTDPCIEVKRAAVLLLCLLLQGLDSNGALQIETHLKHILSSLKAYSTVLDPAVEQHCQTAFGHLDRIAKQLMDLQASANGSLINTHNLVTLHQ